MGSRSVARSRSAGRARCAGAVAVGAVLIAATQAVPAPPRPAPHYSTADGGSHIHDEIDSAAAPNPYGPSVPPPQEPQPVPTVTGIEPNGSSLGIPTTVLRAYHNAERMLASGQRACHLQWWMLAAIGKVESDHAHRGQVDSRGTTLSPILGPRLDGTNGYAAIPDTDHGRWDGDTTWDRAVGPMQFIPSTWRLFGVDANGDRVADPNNIFDAAAAAGRYLCGSGRDLGDPAQLGTAYFSYDPSPIYVQNVLSWARAYASGTTVLPDNTTVLAAHDEPATASEAAPRPAGDSTPGRGPSVSGSPRPPATSPKPDIAQPQQPICAPPGGNPLPGAPSPRLAPQCLLDVTVLGIDPARLLPLPTTTPTTIP